MQKIVYESWKRMDGGRKRIVDKNGTRTRPSFLEERKTKEKINE
jgi:hypothetical protein